MEQQSSPESKIYSRREYQAIVASRQSEVDTTLEALTSDIELANVGLIDLYRQEDTEAYIKYATDVQKYLNDNWKYCDHTFSVLGHWYAPKSCFEMSESSASLDGERTRQEVNSTVVSCGFCVIADRLEGSDEVTPFVAMAFVHGKQLFNTPIGVIEYTPVMHAEPRDITLSYIRQANNETISGNIEEFVEAIETTNSTFVNVTQNQSSHFYSDDLDTQQRFFRKIADDVSEKIPDSNAEDYVILDNALTTKLYAISKVDNSIDVLSNENDKDGIPVQGIVRGVCVIDEIANKGRVHYKKTAQMSMSKDGIGVIIQPDPATNGYLPEDYYDSDLVVPLNSLMSYNFII